MTIPLLTLTGALTMAIPVQVAAPPAGAVKAVPRLKQPSATDASNSADTRAGAQAWIREFRRSLAPLLELRAGWDGPRSKPLDTSLIYYVEHVLSHCLTGVANPKLPFVVPTAAGGLQIEWHQPTLDLEAMFAPDGQITALVEDHTNNQEFESVDALEALRLLSRWAPRAAEARPDVVDVPPARAREGLRLAA